MISSLVSIIFSKDRALQLRAALDSFFLNCEDPGNVDVIVLYRTTSESYHRQYQVLKEIFKKVVFIEETRVVEQIIQMTAGYEYFFLQCDDNMFTGSFSLLEIEAALQNNKDVLGFSLRLGSNTTYCYGHDSNQRIPKFSRINDRMVKYQWNGEQFDFAYPLEVSSSIYRTKDITPIWTKNISVDMPHVEDVMNKSKGRFIDTFPYLLCYNQSVVFSNPMNEVSTLPENWRIRVWGDRRFSVNALTEAFDSGYRMNVNKLVGFVSNGCHQEVELELVK